MNRKNTTPATAQAVASSELLGGWYVVDKNHDNAKKRGPYQHAETAGAVRAEMEAAASERLNEYWNLAVIQMPPNSDYAAGRNIG